VLRSRIWFPIVSLLALAGCRDMVAPVGEGITPSLRGGAVDYKLSSDIHILRQSPDAPALETYEVSFWARKDQASVVVINYLPAAGHRRSRPFLRFEIPKDGLKTDPTDDRLGRRDSVLITLTVDPARFAVDFQPSGVTFDKRHPARLIMWYGQADRDLNGDGAVDALDDYCWAAVAMWTRNAGPWHKMYSRVNPDEPFVGAELRHFSQYAVSW
jgi:hypothetical protein